MTSSVQIKAQKLTANIDLKTLKTLVEKSYAQKFGDLRKRSTWELAYYDLQVKENDSELTPEQSRIVECESDTCVVILPVLPEDEPITPPECEFDILETINDKLKTITVSPYTDFTTDNWFQDTVKQTIDRIKRFSRDWCNRNARGFRFIDLGTKYFKMTKRTPRSVSRRAQRFIVEIVKSSKGMLHAQYSR
jgi:hypothetical protein